MPKPADRKIPFNCYLTAEQLDRLDALSEEHGKPRAELVREAIEDYITRKAKATTRRKEKSFKRAG